MGSGVIRACLFDAYGTLFDVHSADAEHAAAIGPATERLSVLWLSIGIESWV